jgi:nucleoid-associated protein YgaU
MRELGDGNRFGEIYELNKETIKNPRVVLVGQELKIPMNK